MENKNANEIYNGPMATGPVPEPETVSERRDEGQTAPSDPPIQMRFSGALECLRNGHKLQRLGWNGKGLCVQLQTPDENSKMTLPYLYLTYPDVPLNDSEHPADGQAMRPGARVPWLASQTDILAEDWVAL